MSKEYDLTLRSLKTKLKWFEDKYTDNEFVVSLKFEFNNWCFILFYFLFLLQFARISFLLILFNKQ